jgi:Ca2+-binding EF-hand superfamily protein
VIGWLSAILVFMQAPSVAAAASPDAPMTPATAHRFLLDHDSNRDGKLSLDELPEVLRRRFARADLDGNGELDPRELLVGPGRISREARRAEGLRWTRRGLETKAGRPLVHGDSVEFRVPSTVLQRLDQNRDGYADNHELGTILREPDVLFGDRPYSMTAEEARALAARLEERTPAMPSPIDPTNARPSSTAAFDPSLLDQGPVLPNRPDQSDITHQQESIPEVHDPKTVIAPPADAAEPVATKGGGEFMPSAETILEHLDKNHNGQLDRNEAVDQLLANFDKLDRDKNNMLSDKEIKRGLFLARMLGIKPKQDPRTYRAHKPGEEVDSEAVPDETAEPATNPDP